MENNDRHSICDDINQGSETSENQNDCNDNTPENQESQSGSSPENQCTGRAEEVEVNSDSSNGEVASSAAVVNTPSIVGSADGVPTLYPNFRRLSSGATGTNILRRAVSRPRGSNELEAPAGARSRRLVSFGEPYPLHAQLFMRQQREQERRRMILSPTVNTVQPRFLNSVFGMYFNNVDEIVRKQTAEDNINSHTIKRATTQEDLSDMCIICYCIYEINQHVRKLICGHKFHAQCIEEWLKGADACPVCRTLYMTKQAELESAVAADGASSSSRVEVHTAQVHAVDTERAEPSPSNEAALSNLASRYPNIEPEDASEMINIDMLLNLQYDSTDTDD